MFSGNRSGTDRFRRFDIVFDDDLQDFSPEDFANALFSGENK